MMYVTIPTDKRQDFLDLLKKWGSESRHYSFTLTEAAEVLGNFIYLCRVCPWGIFLFHNMYHAMAAALTNNARHLWHTPAFRELIEQRGTFSQSPPDGFGPIPVLQWESFSGYL
jgi:hypothetical protein